MTIQVYVDHDERNAHWDVFSYIVKMPFILQLFGAYVGSPQRAWFFIHRPSMETKQNGQKDCQIW